MDKGTALIEKRRFVQKQETQAHKEYAEAVECKDAKKALVANIKMEFIEGWKKSHWGNVYPERDPDFMFADSSEEIEFALQEFIGDFVSSMDDWVLYKFKRLVSPELTPREALLWIGAMNNNNEERTASLVELIRLQESAFTDNGTGGKNFVKYYPECD